MAGFPVIGSNSQPAVLKSTALTNTLGVHQQSIIFLHPNEPLRKLRTEIKLIFSKQIFEAKNLSNLPENIFFKKETSRGGGGRG